MYHTSLDPMLILAGTFLFLASGAVAQNGNDAKNLYTELFVTRAYNNRIRPTHNQSSPVDVTVDFVLLAINEMNEVTETLKTTGYLIVSWHDEFLAWNSSDYGQFYLAQWPQDEVWRPDVTLENSYNDYKELGAPTLKVESFADGTVNWYPFQVFQSTCSVDITYFPFDEQTCHLKFMSWSYTTFEVTMWAGSNGISLWDYEANPEWDLISTSYKNEATSFEASVTFELKIKRKPLYIILMVIMPIIMLSVLDIGVFILPCESGEKASYAMTVFLSFAVFLTIISAKLPENSESVAVFSVYLILQTGFSTLITIIALVMLRFSSRDDSVPVPRWLRRGLMIIRCKCCCRRKSPKVADSTGSTEKVHKLHPLDDVVSFGSDAVSVASTEDSTEDDLEQLTWKQVMGIFDGIFFLLFTALFIFTSVVCLAYASIAAHGP